MAVLGRRQHFVLRSQEAAVSAQLQPFATASNSGLLEYEETTSASESRDNEATGIIVHGLLGSGRNWRNFSRTLANDLAQTSGRSVSLWSVVAFSQAPPGSKQTGFSSLAGSMAQVICSQSIGTDIVSY